MKYIFNQMTNYNENSINTSIKICDTTSLYAFYNSAINNLLKLKILHPFPENIMVICIGNIFH